MTPPRTKEKEMKLQIVSLILQVVVVIVLIVNIIHHW